MSVRTVFLAAGLAAIAAGSASADQVFATEAGFVSVVPNSVLNTFSTVADGPVSSISYDFGNFSYDISSTNPSSGLYNNNGTISTGSFLSALKITFTSGDVRAFAGDWWGTDADFNEIRATIIITLSDGTQGSFLTNGPRFLGYQSDTSISSIEIRAVNIFNPAYPTMDNFRVAVVPLPPAAWAGLGLLGVIGGVRAVRRRG
jgi:hypothetical protein